MTQMTQMQDAAQRRRQINNAPLARVQRHWRRFKRAEHDLRYLRMGRPEVRQRSEARR
jgi:hypothetical protein